MNGNPFYVPPVFDDQSENIFKFGQMGMQNDQIKEARAHKNTEFMAEQDYRNKALAQQKEGLDIERMKVQKTPSQQNFSVGDVLPLKAIFQEKGYEKAFTPIFDRLDQWGKDNNVTKGVAANSLTTQWDTFFKPQVIEGLQKEYMNRAKDPNFMGSSQEKEIRSLIDDFSTMDGERAKQTFFSQVYQEEANTKAALAAQGDATRAARLNPDTQFVNARSIEYMNKGIPEAEAVSKAYTDKRRMDAETARAGKIDVNTGERKADIKVYVDKFNGARHVVDIKQPYVQAWLRKYGGQLVPENEAEGLEPENKKSAPSKYQVKVKK